MSTSDSTAAPAPAPASASASATSNPYVAIVAKKSRNLHKKLDKIMKADAQQQAGKVLNEEQLILLATRKSVEKQLGDIDQIKEALEEIAVSQELEAVASPPMVVVSEEATEQIADLQKEMESLKLQLEEAASARVAQDEAHVEALAAAVASVSVPAQAPVVETASSVDTSDIQATLQQKIHKMLKLFHVCARYPGERLPADVNYFGKCLMGETSISGFLETLMESTRKAELYLDDELCSQFEASRGMTYKDIALLMDELANELSPPPVPEEPASPMINFFTDNATEEDIMGAFSLASESSPTISAAASTVSAPTSKVDPSVEPGSSTGKKAAYKDSKKKHKPRTNKASSNHSNKDQGASKPEHTSTTATTTATPVTTADVPTKPRNAWGNANPKQRPTSDKQSITANIASTDGKPTTKPQANSRPQKGDKRGGRGGPTEHANGSKGGRGNNPSKSGGSKPVTHNKPATASK